MMKQLYLRTMPLLLALGLSTFSASASATVRCELGDRVEGSVIEEICPFKDGVARLKIGRKWGLIDRSGKFIVEPDLRHFLEFSEGLAGAKLKDAWGLLNKEGKWVVPPAELDEIGHLNGGMAPAEIVQKGYGYIDAKGAWVIPPQFHWAGDFQGPVAITEDKEQRVSMIDRRGRVVKRFETEVMVAREGTAEGFFRASKHVKNKELHGVLNSKGEWVIGPGEREWEMPLVSASRKSRPYDVKEGDGPRQMIDLHGRVSSRAAPKEWPQGEEPSDFWWSEAAHDNNDRESSVFYGFNFKERMRLPGTVPSYVRFSEGMIAFDPSDDKFDGKIGLADDKGKVVGYFPYESIGDMRGGMAPTSVKVPSKKRGEEPRELFGYIDRSGKLAIPPAFAYAGHFSDGRATVIQDGNLGLIDTSGKILLIGAVLCDGEAVMVDDKKKVVWPAHKLGAAVCNKKAKKETD